MRVTRREFGRIPGIAFAYSPARWSHTMLDRQKVEAILGRRFPAATRDQIAAAANAIMGLSDEWEEVLHEDRPGYHYAPECGSACAQAHGSDEATEFRLFRRREH
jgi:hypothetical protein